MPKPFDLKIIEQMLTTHPTANNHFFLFMLGTDTTYIHQPTKLLADEVKKKHYENGETLSYMARLTALTLQEPAPQIVSDHTVAFNTPSVKVINGPTTRGSEVGERIAMSTFLILEALAKGKLQFHLSGHSRGAVQAILIAHELDRIKQELTTHPTKTLYTILTNSPCESTKAAFKKDCEEINETQEVRTQLLTQLTRSTLNLFLIDPVPGDRYSIFSSGWHDPRFYINPPCSKAILLLCRDERTHCIIPVISKGLVPVLIPGHHGTPNGNCYSQQYQAVPDTITNRDTSLVQILVLYKLLAFIDDNTHLFPVQIEHPVDLEHTKLDETINAFLLADKEQRSKELLKLYNELHLHDPAYKHFINTTYPYLGLAQTPTGNRYVHHESYDQYVGLDSIVPDYSGQFINSEHACLFLDEQLGYPLNTNTDLIAQIITLGTGVLNLLLKYQEDEPQIKALLDNKKNRAHSFQHIAHIIKKLSDKYLTDNLSVDAKKILLAAIDNVFKNIAHIKLVDSNAVINDIINECEHMLHQAVKTIAETHYHSLIIQSNQLNAVLKKSLATRYDIHQAFQSFIAALSYITDQETGVLQHLDRAIKEFKQLTPINRDTVKQAIHRKIDSVTEDQLEQKAAELIRQYAETSTPQLTFADQDEHSETTLRQLHTLFHNMSYLINEKARLCRLTAPMSVEIDDDELKLHRDRIIKYTALIFSIQPTYLVHQPEFLDEVFFQQVRRQVIALEDMIPQSRLYSAGSPPTFFTQPMQQAQAPTSSPNPTT